MMSPIHIFIFLYFIKLTFKHHENHKLHFINTITFTSCIGKQTKN